MIKVSGANRFDVWPVLISINQVIPSTFAHLRMEESDLGVFIGQDLIICVKSTIDD
jgi:hypothetical protein